MDSFYKFNIKELYHVQSAFEETFPKCDGWLLDWHAGYYQYIIYKASIEGNSNSIGGIAVDINEDTNHLEVHLLETHPEYRYKDGLTAKINGIGKFLIAFACKLAFDTQNLNKAIYIYSKYSSQSFYEKLGAQESPYDSDEWIIDEEKGRIIINKYLV